MPCLCRVCVCLLTVVVPGFHCFCELCASFPLPPLAPCDLHLLLLSGVSSVPEEPWSHLSGFRLEGDLYPGQESPAVLGLRKFVASSLPFFVDSEKKLAPDSTSLEGLFAAGDSDCLPGGPALQVSFSFQGAHCRVPVCPTLCRTPRNSCLWGMSSSLIF